MIDDLRTRFPTLGFALYAIEPGGPVTFEVYDGEDVFSFKGETTDAAIAGAFPPPPPEPPAPAIPDQAPADVFD